MGERRFVICEESTEHSSVGTLSISITESELDKRLCYIHTMLPLNPTSVELSNAKCILLHGEAKEKPDVWEAWLNECPFGPTAKKWFREMVELIRKE